MTPARIREAERASIAFHWYLTQLGIQATLDMLTLWQDVPAQPGVPGWAAWLPRSVRHVLLRRRQAQEVAQAYYRLNRALMTGTANATKGEAVGGYTTLDTLRDEFSSSIGQDYRDPLPTEAIPEDLPVSTEARGEALVDEASEFTEPAEDERVLLEEIARLDELDAMREREAEADIRRTLEELGRIDLERKLQREREKAKRTAQEAEQAAKEAHRQSGAKQASGAARVVMNGGRDAVFDRMYRDKRAIGYVRVSRTGTPCDFCAMLISRGLTALYYQGKSGPARAFYDGDKYHANCFCYAVPIFSREQFNTGQMFQLNREYREAWGKYGGSASSWRKYIREENKKRDALEADSQ